MSVKGGPKINKNYLNNLKRATDAGGFFVKPNATDIQRDIDKAIENDPSLLLVPTAGKAGTLFSTIPNDGTADFTVSRNGTATYFDKDGLLKTATANEPRFEFDPLTGEYKGVLVEPAATNLITQSLNFQGWLIQGNRIVRTFNDGVAPDGTMTATKFTRNIEGAYLLRQVIPNNPFTLGSTWTYSVWVKAVEQSINVNLDISDRGNTLFTVTPEDGWKRISATHTWTDTNFSNVGHFFDVSVTNLSMGNSHYLWGAQLEAGSVATSYIPTTGSQVTRPADSITRTNAQDLIGQTEGSVYVEFYYIYRPNANVNPLVSLGQASNNRIDIYTVANGIAFV